MNINALKPIFEQLQVVEFASALAGPLVGTFLKELGAQVLKIEPKAGDVSRHWRAPEEPADNPNSYYYCAANGNKSSQQINLHTERESINDLVINADIILTNFTAEKASVFKLDYGTIFADNPSVILANISGISPEIDQPAFDILMQAYCGLLSVTGFSDRSPTRVPIPLVDILCGHQLKEAILCALLKRNVTGKGSEIQVSLFDSMLSALTHLGSNFLMGNIVGQANGMQHPNIAPYGDLFYTKDQKQVILAVGSDAQFARLCLSLQDEQLSRDARFIKNEDRVLNRPTLHALLTEKFKRYDLKDWLHIFAQFKVPAGPIRNIAEVLRDEQAKRMIKKEKMNDGNYCARMRQTAFLNVNAKNSMG